MDLFQAISSLNKVGIIFFILTLGALVYEIVAFRKEKDTKRTVPKIPDFDPNKKPDIPSSVTSPIPVEETTLTTPVKKKPSMLPIFITGGLLLLIGGFTIFSFIRGSTSSNAEPVAQIPVAPPQTQVLSSSGIKVFDSNWQALSMIDLQALPPQTKVFIGIETIQGADISQARIRVNESSWTDAHVTTALNPDENVYFIEYMIPEGVTSLKIEGQLHSASSGWPQ